MKTGMPMTHRLPEVCFRPLTTWIWSRVSILLFVLCLVLASSTTSAAHPMTFHIEFNSNIDQLTTTKEALLLKKSVSLVTHEVGRVLKVSNNKKVLRIEIAANKEKLCQSVKVPPRLKGIAGDANVIADYALFVRAQHCNSEDSGAVSAPCSFTNRPTVGVISFCSSTLVQKDPTLLVAVISRHLISLLGLDWRIIRRSKTPENSCFLRHAINYKCWKSDQKNETTPLLVSSPQLLLHAKNFTGNKSLLGLPLSADGRSWDSRVMFTSVLADSPITRQLAQWLSLDVMTLALLDDLSWYQVQWKVFGGDDILWGRGSGSLPKTCASACVLGFCNRTQNAPCFQLGPRANNCSVCQWMASLRTANGLVCLVKNCSETDETYSGFCATESRGTDTVCSGKRKCLKYHQACQIRRKANFAVILAAKIKAFLTTTSSTSTIVPTSIPVNGYRFTVRFDTLDFDSVANFHQDAITSQIVTKVGELLGVTDRQIVKVTGIRKGSTIVDFIVYDIEYSAKKVSLILQQGLHQKVFYLTIGGKTYQASSIQSHDYEETRSYLTEVIVGSTLGLVLIIGVTSVIVIILVKKVKRPTNTVYPSPVVPSDGDSEFGRSNSFQTVSVASYAAVYELRRDWGSNPRPNPRPPASLRNVVVSGANLQARTSASEESGHL